MGKNPGEEEWGPVEEEEGPVEEEGGLMEEEGGPVAEQPAEQNIVWSPWEVQEPSDDEGPWGEGL